MANSGADNVLADYFDDLLGGASEEDVSESPAPIESDAAPTYAKPSVDSAPPAVAVTAPAPARATHTVHTPTPQRKAQPSALPDPVKPMDLSMLEEQKRLQLQRLLSQQVVAPAPPKTETGVATETDVQTKTKLQTQVEQKLAPAPVASEPSVESAPIVAEQTAMDVDEVSATVQRYLTWGDNGRPLWAEGEFDVLLFDVAGLSLAVPLVALGHIVPLDKKLTRLQGQSDWFMGILPSSVGDIRTVNTALFVMPERYKAEFVDSAKYVVTIDGLPWGLAIDGVHQPIRLGPDDVKWRSERSKRPWLAGTVKSHMCALIDIPHMAQQLELSDMNHR